MLEVLPGRPIDSMLREVLTRALRVTGELGVDCFVGGAMARDILLTHVLGQDSIRATRDVDLGIFIGDWDEFSRLKQRLIADGDFVAEEGNAHRLRYRSVRGVPLDLIPFGAVSSPDQTVAWPPDHEIVLNVAGFEDACASAVVVHLGDGLRVKTCSLPSLAELKLLAWRDRGLANNKDALDFELISGLYGPAQSVDRLYDDEIALLESADFDLELAGAHLLGKDAAAQCSRETALRIREILGDASLRQRLVDQLLRVRAGLATAVEEARLEGRIAAFEKGFVGQVR